MKERDAHTQCTTGRIRAEGGNCEAANLQSAPCSLENPQPPRNQSNQESPAANRVDQLVACRIRREGWDFNRSRCTVRKSGLHTAAARTAWGSIARGTGVRDRQTTRSAGGVCRRSAEQLLQLTSPTTGALYLFPVTHKKFKLMLTGRASVLKYRHGKIVPSV